MKKKKMYTVSIIIYAYMFVSVLGGGRRLMTYVYILISSVLMSFVFVLGTKRTRQGLI